MTISDDSAPVAPERVRAFARFFKRYMSVSSLVVAALPIPVTSFKLIPTFAAQSKIFAVYTSLFCFLLLGFIFYSRHFLAKVMFPTYAGYAGSAKSRHFGSIFINLLPLVFIIASFLLIFAYNEVLDRSVDLREGVDASKFDFILANTELDDIFYSSQLMLLYIGIFVAAESAFILMAIKEYLQDLLKITDLNLIRGIKDVPGEPETNVD